MDAPEPHLPLTTDINGATLSHRVCRALLVDAGAFRAGIHRRLDPRVIPAAFGGYAVALMIVNFFRPPTGNSAPRQGV